MGAGVRERSPLLGEGIRGPVRLARLGIGMISRSAQRDGTSIVHQCLKGIVGKTVFFELYSGYRV